MCCTVLVVAALAFYAGPASAQEAATAGSDVSTLAPLLSLFDDGGACTGVPDSVPRVFDFTTACADHDACYASGDQPQAQCDTQFRQDMTALCAAQHPSALEPARYACLFFAQLYHGGVALFGQFF